ncbi:MAG TPA: hypothetical protein VFZ36_02515 [Vicinamibacterales bacterium]
MTCLVLRARCSVLVLCLVLVLGACAACGSKGDPLPPLRPAPAKTEGLSAARVEGEPITLRFTIPARNDDGTGPVDVGSMQVFAVTKPAGDPPPTAADLAGGGDATRIATIDVRRQPLGGMERADTPQLPPGPAPGETITWQDTTEAAAVYPTPMVRYYAVAGVSSRRRIGVVSDVVAVPLTAVPDPPKDLTVSFTETAIKLDWLGVAQGARYRIYEVKEGRASDPPLNAEPLAATTFEDTRLEFGVERCYLVRAVVVSTGASLESAAAGPECITPRDVFPPPAPANLTAVSGPGAVSLIWDAVEAVDLAGYLVLRGDAPGETLLPLFETPIADTTYKDATTVAGTAYVYVVVAVDKATPPNRSPHSNRVEEVGRQ